MRKIFIIFLFISMVSCNHIKTDSYQQERISFFHDIFSDTTQFNQPIYISKNAYFTAFEGFIVPENDNDDLSFDKLTRNQFLMSLFKEKDTLLYTKQWKEKFDFSVLETNYIKVLDLDYDQLEKSHNNFKDSNSRLIPIYTFVKPYFNKEKNKAFLRKKAFGTELWNLYEKENNTWVYKKQISIILHD